MKSPNIAPLYKIICLLALAFMAANAQAKKPKAAESESSATLAETLAFIDQKLAAHFYPGPGTVGGVNHKIISEELSHNGDCQGIKYLRTIRNDEKTYVWTVALSLTDMNPDQIMTESSAWGGSFELHTIGKREKIINTRATSQGEVLYTDYTDYAVMFALNDREIVERVAKAFKHAIELCTGGYKKEPF